MTFDIAIPSYRRAETLRDCTLRLLQQTGAPAERVTVFVADQEERDRYASTLTPGSYGQLVVAVPGMRAVRNFIQQYYDEGQAVLNLDDDLRVLSRRVSDRDMMPVDNLVGWASRCFDLAERAGARLWGVYPVHNAFFMQPTVTTDLRYIVGCLWGVRNARSSDLAVTLDDKEDFERTIKFYLADGAVVRFNDVAPKTNYYGEPGGMQVERTAARVDQSARLLVQRYPQLCQLNLTKKSGHTELRLRDRRKTAKPR